MAIQSCSKHLLWRGMLIALLCLSAATSVPAATMCGPGLNWMDDCTAGTDRFVSDVLHTVFLFDTSQTLTGDLFSANTRVERSDPSGDPSVIQAKLSFTASAGGFTMRVGDDAPEISPSLGTITERPDMLTADSFFDVFFVLEGTSLGPLVLRNRTAVRMEAVIDRIPPLVPPGTCPGNPDELNCYFGGNLEPPIPLFDQNGVLRGELRAAVHEPKIPEPATGVLSCAALIGLLLAKKGLLKRRA